MAFWVFGGKPQDLESTFSCFAKIQIEDFIIIKDTRRESNKSTVT